MSLLKIPRSIPSDQPVGRTGAGPIAFTMGPDGCNCPNKPKLRSPSSFQDELSKLIQNDKDARASDAMRTQLSRSIRRSTGVRRKDQVSEEQLFAGVLGTEVLRETNRTTYRAFADRVRALASYESTGKSAEDSAKIALNELVARGDLTTKTAKNIYARAFAASQLDDNDCALFDSNGATSAAVTNLQSAVFAGTLGITKANLGKLDVLPRSPRERAAGHSRSPEQLTHTERSTLEVA